MRPSWTLSSFESFGFLSLCKTLTKDCLQTEKNIIKYFDYGLWRKIQAMKLYQKGIAVNVYENQFCF